MPRRRKRRTLNSNVWKQVLGEVGRACIIAAPSSDAEWILIISSGSICCRSLWRLTLETLSENRDWSFLDLFIRSLGDGSGVAARALTALVRSSLSGGVIAPGLGSGSVGIILYFMEIYFHDIQSSACAYHTIFPHPWCALGGVPGGGGRVRRSRSTTMHCCGTPVRTSRSSYWAVYYHTATAAAVVLVRAATPRAAVVGVRRTRRRTHGRPPRRQQQAGAGEQGGEVLGGGSRGSAASTGTGCSNSSAPVVVVAVGGGCSSSST